MQNVLTHLNHFADSQSELPGTILSSTTTSRCRPPISFARTMQMSTVVFLSVPSTVSMLVSLRETVAPVCCKWRVHDHAVIQVGQQNRGMKLVLTIIINYGDSNCASTSQNHVQRVCWLYHQLEYLILLHNGISQDGYGCDTDTLSLCSCGWNHHFSLK